MSEVSQKRAFIISPISGNDVLDGKHFEQVQRYMIKPVCESNGYTCERADQLSWPGRITNHVIDCILEYELVIADLSILNPNVFYELAIRHATNLPVLLIAHKDTRIPFDVRQERVVFYSFDLDDLEESKAQLDRLIKTVDSPSYENESPLKSKIRINTNETVSSREFMERTYDLMEEVRDTLTHFKPPSTIHDFASPVAHFRSPSSPLITAKNFRGKKGHWTLTGSGFSPYSLIWIYLGGRSLDHMVGMKYSDRDGSWITKLDLGPESGALEVIAVDSRYDVSAKVKLSA